MKQKSKRQWYLNNRIVLKNDQQSGKIQADSLVQSNWISMIVRFIIAAPTMVIQQVPPHVCLDSNKSKCAHCAFHSGWEVHLTYRNQKSQIQL